MTEPKKIGFARLDPAYLKAISAMGGAASHAKGKAHKFDHETGQMAARRRAELQRQKKGLSA